MIQITEAEQTTANGRHHSQPRQIEIFQTMEHTYTLALSHLRKGDSYVDVVEHQWEDRFEINSICWLMARNVVGIVQELIGTHKRGAMHLSSRQG